ncbi:MAG: DHH family phosphoesterase [Acidobacteria bacterium]|nr:DHH family phosphoesterase [Acidobacteriota bacterium]
MTILLILNDPGLYPLVQESLPPGSSVYFWARTKKSVPAGLRGRVISGSRSSSKTFEKVSFDPELFVLLQPIDHRNQSRVVDAIARVHPQAKILVLGNGKRAVPETEHPLVRTLTWGELFNGVILEEIRRLETLERVTEIRWLFQDCKKIGILLQDDPDPDAIASGLALRALIGRNKLTAPMLTFGEVTRPENLHMIELLDIEVNTIHRRDLAQYDKLAMVDVQPSYFGDTIPSVDLVVDHHPEQKGYTAAYRDIRSSYGATSTILTEYLRAADVEITQRHATALLYGIKTDTLSLDREVSKADIDAFSYLYPKINFNILRRIERPELPLSTINAFSKALDQLSIEKGLAFIYLGAVEREDVIPQIAEFCLQIEGADWSAAAGKYENNLIISVRNVGFVRSAGEVVKSAFGDIGSAGGHRSMAKAVIPLDRFREKYGSISEGTIRQAVSESFLEQLP